MTSATHHPDANSIPNMSYLGFSYNSVMNSFQCKRTVYGRKQYQSRAMIACMSWNENINQESTSIWQGPLNESRQKKKLEEVHNII